MGQFTQLVWWRIESDSLHSWCGGGLNGTVYTTGVVEDRMGQFTQLVWWRIECDSLHNWCGGGLNGTIYSTGVVED